MTEAVSCPLFRLAPHGLAFSPATPSFLPSFPPSSVLPSGSTLPGGTGGQLALGIILFDLWPVLFVLFSFSVVWFIVVQVRGQGDGERERGRGEREGEMGTGREVHCVLHRGAFETTRG